MDGHTVFIDRHLPRTLRWLMRRVRVEPFLLTHEIVENTDGLLAGLLHVQTCAGVVLNCPLNSQNTHPAVTSKS
jgi:hypothetical protein